MSRKFQFSLGRLFLTVAFATLVASHVYTSWKLKQARGDIGRMATELGLLAISDSSRLNVLALPTFDGMTWRWRVHVPSDREYAVYSATREIPSVGLPSADAGVRTFLEPGEYVITVAVRHDHLDKWKLPIAQRDTSTGTTIEDADAAWLVNNADYMSQQAGSGGTEVAESEKPMVLLRLFCDAGTGARPPAKAGAEGIMIWAAEYKRGALVETPASSGAAATDETPAPLQPLSAAPRPAD